METQKLLIEIEVDSNKAVQNIVEQKDALEKLKAEKKNLEAINKELSAQENVDTAAIQRNKEAIVEKEAKIKNLTAEIRTQEKVVQASTKTTKDETGAYQKLSLEYAVASQKAKDMAVVHGVNSEQAKKATEAASKMDKQLKEVDKSVGQNQRNVGNYSSALEGMGESFSSLPGPLGNVGGAVGQVSNALKALLANPVVLVISAIVAAFMLLKQGLDTNREATERLNQIMAPFKNVLQSVLTVIGEVANVLLKGVQALSAFTAKIFSFIPAVDRMNKANQESMAIEKELQRIRRADIVDTAQDAQVEREIAEMKKKMRMKDVYDEKERLGFARKIDQLALADAVDDKKRAEDEVQNYIAKKRKEGKNSQTKYTNDELKELADLVVKKESKLTEYYQKTSRSASMAATLTEELEAEKAKAAEAAESRRAAAAAAGAAARQKSQDDEVKMFTSNIAIMNEEYQKGYDAEKLMDEDYKKTKNKQLTDIYNAEIALIDKKKKYGKLTIEEETLARMEANKKYLAAQQQLNADLNAELVKKIDHELSLESIKDKMLLLNEKLTNDEKHKMSIDGINERYEAEKKKIELTITDETDKNRKLEILNQQHNLDIATADKAHQDLVNKQKLEDEAQLLESKYAMMKEGVDKEYLLKKDALDKEKAERLAKVTAGSEAERAINEEYTAKEIELNRQKNIAKAQEIVAYAELATGIASGINDFLNALGEREYSNFEKVKNAELEVYTRNAQSQIDVATQKYNEDVALLDEQLANKTISQEEYDAKRKELDKSYADFKEGITSGISEKEKQIQEELDAKKAEIEYEAAKRQKALAIANAIIGGAAAVIAALATPFAGPVLAIAAGATAALQLATIIATPIPDNRKGGSSGGSGSVGGSGTAYTGTGYSHPDTSNTTNGIVTGNLSKDSGYATSTAIERMNTEMAGYVPVLVLSDLTKEQEKIKVIKMESEL